MKYTAKKYARDEHAARALLAAHGGTFLMRGLKWHHGRRRDAIFAFSVVHNCNMYVIMAANGSTDLTTIKIYII